MDNIQNAKIKGNLSTILTQYIFRAKQTCPKLLVPTNRVGKLSLKEALFKIEEEEKRGQENFVYQAKIPQQENQEQLEIPVQESLGLELNEKVNNSTDLITLILESGLFVPENGLTEAQIIEHKALFTNLDDLDNNRNMGYQYNKVIIHKRSIVGMSTLGVLGFVATAFNIFGAIGGGFVGLLMGRQAGKQISKRMYQKEGNLREFDIFLIRMRCVRKWTHNMIEKYKFNVNVTRFALERFIAEFKPLLHYKYFRISMQREIKKKLAKIRLTFLLEQSINAMILAYKLGKSYFKILALRIIYSKFSRGDIEFILAYTVLNILKPFHSLFKDNLPKPNIDKKQTIVWLCQKIEKLFLDETVQALITKFPDAQLSLEYIKVFTHKMTDTIHYANLEQFIQSQNYQDIKALGIPVMDEPVVINKPRLPDRRQSLHEVSKVIDENYFVEKVEIRRNSLEHIPESEMRVPPQYQESRVNRISMKASTIKIQQLDGDNEQIDGLSYGSRKQSPIKSQYSSVKLDGSLGSFYQRQQGQVKQINRQESQSQGSKKLKIVEPINRLSNELDLKFQMMVDIMGEPVDTWEVVLRKDGVFIYKTYKEGNSAVFVKGYGDIAGVNKETLFTAIYDSAVRTKWDKILENFHVVEVECEDVDIVYYFVQSPPGVANRDFLQKRVVRKGFPQANQICILFFSVEKKNAPAPKNYVRGETFLSGYIIEDLPNGEGARLQFVSNNDVKGNIPQRLVNFVATRAPIQWFNNLRKGCLQLPKQVKNNETQSNKIK